MRFVVPQRYQSDPHPSPACPGCLRCRSRNRSTGLREKRRSTRPVTSESEDAA